ncbi:ABC transporter permease [Marinibaculum pumilum]|uniref:ABC transporter permease n=1 Tax=Marinibaculum pumilum TaxID=1766165 RepID=A0ABV7L9P5_9PROT
MRLEQRAHVPLALAVAAPVGAAIAALALCSLLLLWADASVARAYGLMLEGALGSRFAIAETLARAAPLILTGLAVAVAFRAKLWNIGAEGQLYAGALAAVAVASQPVVDSAWLIVPLMLLAGAAAGAVLLIGPALLKLRLGVDEVVTTLLLNFIMLLFVGMMLEGPMQDPMSLGWPQSEPIADSAVLPPLLEKTRLHAGLLMALVAAVLVWFLMARTTLGFAIRATGANAGAARFAGLPVGRTVLATAAISGALAGLAGVGEVAGLKGYVTQDLSPGYGYSGIVVAMLAQLSPVGVVPAALFIAAVFVGADSMSRSLGVSSYLADLIVATSLLTMLVAVLVSRYRIRRG